MTFKPLSTRQLGTLKYMSGYDVSTDHCRSIHQITLWSLLHGGFVEKIGDKVVLTKKGKDYLHDYVYAKPSMRQQEDELSNRCRRLLHVVMTMRKSA